MSKYMRTVLAYLNASEEATWLLTKQEAATYSGDRSWKLVASKNYLRLAYTLSKDIVRQGMKEERCLEQH
ncbi:MAG: hypothetical protein ACLRX6_03525 [Limosilactobacillus pontis]|uniref:hypothetical protein n=1 Tax=Limosilactobacillus pontis TaxID=35787 RepID=UPI00399FE90B